MTDRKISELPAATLPLEGTEPTVVVQGGETRQAPAEQLSTRFTPLPSVFVAGTTMGGAGQTPTANRMLVMPYTPRRRMTIQRFRIRTHNTAGASDFALAIYQSGPNGLPLGSPVYGGAVFTPTYPFVYVGYSGLSLVLEPRRYWLAFVASAAAGQYTEASNNGLPQPLAEMHMDIGFTVQDPLSSNNCVMGRNGVTPGIWPTLTGQLSDFSTLEAVFRSPAFSFQVAA